MNIKKFMAGALSVLLMGITIASILPANIAFAKTEYKFDASLKAGYTDKLYVGNGTPVYVTVENQNLSNFEGNIQVIVPSFDNNNIMYEQELTLGAGETKTIEYNVTYPVPADYFNVRITNKKGKVLWSELQEVYYNRKMKEVNVGVLSDDFTALAYMDRQHFLSDNSIYTSLIELDKDNLSEDYQSLSSIDVIVISDYSTDLLTKEQIGALNLWIQNGGLLIVGTGSTANKTLSGLNGSIFSASLEEKGDRETTLGVSIMDYSYVNVIKNSTGDGYSDARQIYLTQLFNNSSNSNDYYYYASRPFDDDDNDGINDHLYDNCQAYYNAQGVLMDALGNEIAKENEYLFDYSTSSYTDVLSDTIHYKYYDERYCVVPDDDDDFNDFFDNEVKKDTTGNYDNICYGEYMRIFGLDPKFYIYSFGEVSDNDELEETFDKVFGDDFLEFKRHFFFGYYYYLHYNLDVFNDLSRGDISGNLSTTDYNYIVVDSSEYNLSGADDFIEADTKNGDTFAIGQKISRGSGYIVLCSVDFTKNPIPKTSYAGDFFRNMVEYTIGSDFLKKSSDYEDSLDSSYYYNHNYNNNDSETDLLTAVSSAPIPPILLYVGSIIAYLIAVIVIFIIFSAKKKTYSLWKIYPVLMILLAFTIFCLGFSTRLLRLNVNIVSVIKPQNGIMAEKDYVAAIIPKSKEYAINFSNDVKLDKSIVNDRYASFSSYTEVDYDTYTVAYRETYDSIQGIITNKPALGTETFKTDSVYASSGGLEVELGANPDIVGISAVNITVKNNYSTDLEDVVVIFQYNGGMNDYYLGTIKAGEKKIVATGKYYEPDSNYSYYFNNDSKIKEDFSKNNLINNIKGLLLGEISSDYRRYLKRKFILDYAIDTQFMIDKDHIDVIAFPKSSIGSNVVDQKNCKINRYEAVIVSPSVDDLRDEYLIKNMGK